MIDVEKNGHILELYIKTNETNSLGKEFFDKLASTMQEAEKDRTVKAILLSGRNDKFFSNGFNPEIFVGKTLEEIKSVLNDALGACARVLFSNKPVICAMNGHSMGVGAVLAIFSDYRILVEKKGRLGFPESMIGINFPSTAALVLKDLVGIKTARDLLYSGKGLKADEAVQLGLVEESATPEELIAKARKWCQQFEGMAIESVVGIKLALRDSQRLAADQFQKRDIDLLAEAVFSSNGQEGMRSILERRRPVFS
ncbi:enoyl-CoA hydratase/isomerase family protein [Leptospira wolffii]|uniref:Enoyl-CoA hydratase n=2 Tax=Leptospira wolffii TaxID=409998 RepID=A0A2M9ZDH2_9LEPT|nr:enoyl-CoA hydratase/isomerase family protein [Leptospira wolffii]PJZ66475.1 enoyl-CoA hydratase [Leptospira wolffii]TGK59958.1 enoyl-CoA hydratase/isomerase family protein [Leptospira wolffii]TGK75966.1 enoyl-CoA hydratase/isomerase family protein [Leptospira wolffii]TGL30217.1 enoyl-CoA hydratase/isomerase family protein [Leptospira wolffii]